MTDNANGGVVIEPTCDERVVLACRNETRECFFWQVELPDDCTPEHALELANAHRATHGAA